MSDTIQITETCGCGAKLVFSSSRSVAGLDVAHAQSKFHRVHRACRPQGLDKSKDGDK